jgi:catechol 2,3-dioxygenase-like lactoylglutathione lyase family enzyme
MSTGKNVLEGIDTVIVRVSDVGKSKQWYVDKLGLKVVWDDPGTRLVVLDTGSPTSLTLWQTDKKIEVSKDTASYPIFRTTCAEQARKELHANGVEVGEVIEDDAVKYFFFYDPDGNILEACQVHA